MQGRRGVALHWDRLYRDATGALPWEVDDQPKELFGWRDRLPPNASVLDLGCGRGRHAVALAEGGFRVTGIDISPAAVRAARARATRHGLPNAVFDVADILDYQPRREFDLVYDYSVFHHIDEDDRLAYVRCVERAVVPGGLFALVCYSDGDVFADGRRKRVGTLGNMINHPTSAEILELFRPYFRVRTYEETGLGPAGKHHAHHFIFRRLAEDGSKP